MKDYIFGKQPCISALQGDRKVSKVLIANTSKNNEVVALCKKSNVKYDFVPHEELDKITNHKNHQGVVCYVSEFQYTELDDLLYKLRDKKEPLLLILDGVEDPVNFGSLIRTCSCFNVDGIIIAKDRQVQVTPTVTKISTGALEFVPIVRVTNINTTIERLKKERFWIVATDGKGDKYHDEINYSGPIALIVGSEGRGISKLTLKNSDFVIKIPISGPITSLNASIAGAIVISQIASYRRHHSK